MIARTWAPGALDRARVMLADVDTSDHEEVRRIARIHATSPGFLLAAARELRRPRITSAPYVPPPVVRPPRRVVDLPDPGLWALLGQMHDGALAALLGVCRLAVMRRRQAAGLPACSRRTRSEQSQGAVLAWMMAQPGPRTTAEVVGYLSGLSERQAREHLYALEADGRVVRVARGVWTLPGQEAT